MGGGREKKAGRPLLPPSLLSLSFSLPHPPAHCPRRPRRRSGVGGPGVCLLSRRRRASPRSPRRADALSFFLSLCLSLGLCPSRPPRPAASAFPVRQARPPGLARSSSPRAFLCLRGLARPLHPRRLPCPSLPFLPPLLPTPFSGPGARCACACVSLRQRRHLSPANELRPSRQPETQASVAAAPGAATAAAAPAAAAAAAAPATAAAAAAASAAAAAAAASTAAAAASAAAPGAEQRRREG